MTICCFVCRRLFGKEHVMKVLERLVCKIRPDKWDEFEGIDNKYDAVEGKYAFPPKRYYRCFSGPHDVFTSIMEREWESRDLGSSSRESLRRPRMAGAWGRVR